ncbi:MAG: hypothetical protein F8N15_04970 [Methanobacterium sp.]|nr:hypothetical protein [Methanobacterium sp.]
MMISNLDKILGMMGLILGVEVISIVIFLFILINIRNPVLAGLVGNISSLGMMVGIIFIFVKQEIGKLD